MNKVTWCSSIASATNKTTVDAPFTLWMLRQYCQEHNVPCISQGTEDFLHDYINENKPKYIGEIWSAVWYSAIFMAQLIQNRGGNIWSIEHSFPDYQRACHNAWALKTYNTTFYHSDANTVEYEKLSSQKMDLVYIDGRKSDYLHYLERIVPILTPYTTIIFDDVIKFAHKTTLLYEFLEKKQIKHTIHQLDPDDGILVIANAGEQLANIDFSIKV